MAKKQKSKIGISYDIFKSTTAIQESFRGGSIVQKLNRDELVSALVFIQKAEQILKSK